MHAVLLKQTSISREIQGYSWDPLWPIIMACINLDNN